MTAGTERVPFVSLTRTTVAPGTTPPVESLMVPDTVPVMIWVAGPDKARTFFNEGWLVFTGRTMQQELGNGWMESVHPQDLDRCVGTYSSSFYARRSFQMEYRLRRADGEYRWLLDVGAPRFERGGAFVGEHGSWNRQVLNGYKVVYVPFSDGKPSGPAQDVVTGFLNSANQARGRPVGVAIDKSGALLVADDSGNTVWRVTAAHPQVTQR